MIQFVLDGAGQQAAAGKLDGPPFDIQGEDVRQGGPFDFAVDFRETEAAFRRAGAFAGGFDHGVDQHQRHDAGHVGLLAVQFEGGRPVGDAAQVQHCQLQGAAHLLGGQADALVGVHGFQHGGGQRLDFRQ